MPPRWLSGIIVAFWLATTGWLLWHDLLPRWLAGEPPLFLPDFVDEVQQKSSSTLPINWIVLRQEEKQDAPHPVFRAATSVKYLQDKEAYALNAKLEAAKDPTLQPVVALKILKVNSIASAYIVDRSGQLLSLRAEVKVQLDWKPTVLRQLFMLESEPLRKDSSSGQITFTIEGEVRGQQFFVHCSAASASLEKPMQFDLPPAAVAHKGSVLMPLHPINHIRGLRLGQSWRQPLVDPLRDAFARFSNSVRWINARVLPQPQMLVVDQSKTSCLVIEYTNDDNELMGRTWVEEDGERVLQQEAILEGSRWIMQRESRRSRGR